ncbi:MAG TPA: ATPase domain-containing protein [Opitutaceae bacterium]|nr:ATPase domain-containing protein [Opitutaceae bacterium]
MKSESSAPSSERCTTGVPGLDEILGGGLPRNRLYLVQGHPGVGKSTLALQFLLDGVKRGERVLYITLSETREELESVAFAHGWDISPLNLFEMVAKDEQLHTEADTTFFHPSEVELNRTTKTLLDEIERCNPSRVVFDSLSEMRMLADTPLRYRRQILQLKQFLAGKKCTVLFLDDLTSGIHDLQVESIVHGVVTLTRSSPSYGAARRQVHVQKMRGVKFSEGLHDSVVQTGGVVVFPRLVAADHNVDFRHEAVPSGIKGLDALLGGGLDRGTSNMFMGPPGTGKSTLTLKFAHSAAQRGEKVMMFIFDEVTDTLVSRSAKLGMDIGPFVANGLIRIQQVDPAEIAPGELAHKIRRGVQTDDVRLVVIDSINGYMNAMPEERHLNLQLHELLSFLNQQGVLTIMVLAQQGLVGQMQSGVDLTYLADTVLILRYFEAAGAVKQAISTIKKRSGSHERTIREFRVSSHGIEVGEPLTNMHGVLTGVPIFLNSNANPLLATAGT